jgi:hypothetical protein
MAVAPEMFDEKHALGALQLAEKVLRSPLGMKTLDPNDMRYQPNYDNSDDSTDASVAKGFNYHNVCILLLMRSKEDQQPSRDLNGDGHLATFCGRICISTPG